MIYEMRIYRCVPGRLPDLLKRFETITLGLWQRHGIQQAGFWTTLVGESNHDLTYLPRLAKPRRARHQMDRLPIRQRMDPQARRN